MKIKIDFSNMDEPTAKQIDLVQYICRTLRIPKPEYTFEEYSKFIDRYLKEVRDYGI